MSNSGEKRPREDEDHDIQSRPRKRPGGAARISRTEAQAVHQRQQQRAADAEAAVQTRGLEEVVRQHYNAVPQRGREWRKTDSRIKGLRSFNNWVKSTVIHKFSPSEPGTEPLPLRVLDIGCGKGGDLQKWQQAPQPVELYIGIDPAEVSIEQARERYRQMRSRGRHGGRGGRGGRGGFHDRGLQLFDAEFLAEDAFAYSLGDLRIIRQVGYGPGSRWGPAGGFDVVSMMFCMHYAFESESKAKGMLSNVANSLRKGGRFFGVIPNSDVIKEKVVGFNERTDDKEREKASEVREYQASAGEEPSAQDSQEKSHAKSPDEASPHSASHLPNGSKKVTNSNKDKAGPNIRSTTPPKDGSSSLPLDGGKEKSASSPNHQDKTNIEKMPQSSNAEWGNSIYRVRFPGETPKDGIFRPPFGWKYSYFLEEAVEEVPEYVVPWEAFRAIAEDYNLELQYRKSFAEIWQEERNNPVFGPLSERMGVRGPDAGPLLVTSDEMEAASFYHAFCFYKI